MAMVALGGSQGPNEADLSSSLAGPVPVTLSLCHPLTTDDGSRSWPRGLLDQDLILFSLQAPLLASDLLWLQQVPDDQSAWLLVATDAQDASTDAVASVRDDLPERWRERILVQESVDAAAHCPGTVAPFAETGCGGDAAAAPGGLAPPLAA